MRFIRTFFAVVAVFVLVSPLEAQTVTLEQAVREALSHGADQAILASNLEASRAVYSAAQAKAGLTLGATASYGASQTWNSSPSAFPTLSSPTTSGVPTAYDSAVPQTASAGLTLATPITTLSVKGNQNWETTPTGSTVTAPGVTMGFNQVIWNGYPGGPAAAAADQARLTLKIAELTALANHNKLVLTLKEAYYTLLSDQQAIEQLTQTVQSRDDSLKFVQAKLALGQATRIDLKSAQVALLSSQLDLTSGQRSLEIARRRLSNLMGRANPDGLTAAVAPDPAVTAANLSLAVETALKNRTEIQSAQAAAALQQISVSSAFGAILPTVSLGGSLTYTDNPTPSTSSYFGLVNLTVAQPILDAGAASSLLKQATALKAVAQLQVDQLKNSIPVDVSEGWYAWQDGQQRLVAAQGSVEVAQGQLAITQAQYDAGIKTLTDLQTAQIALSTAQSALIKAKITSQLAALQVQSLMGL